MYGILKLIMKLDLKLAVTITIGLLTVVGIIVAIPWKLDGRYEQKVHAVKSHEYVLEQIGGMNRNYLESRISDLEWKLFQLQAAGERRRLTDLEKSQIRSLKKKIERLKEQLARMR